MTKVDYNLNTELGNTTNLAEKLQPELLRDFITYWSIRKSPSSTTDSLIQKLKCSNHWFDLIESNHKFRSAHGEDLAERLIKVIEVEISEH